MIPLFLLLSVFACAQLSQPGQPTQPSLPPETTGGTQTTPRATPPPLGADSGWRTVQERDGVCQWSVPGGWAFDKGHDNTIRYGANQAIAVLRHTTMGSDWDTYKQKIRTEYSPTQVFIDTPDRLWIQYSRNDRANHYIVAAPSGTTVCVANIDVDPNAQGDLSLVIPRLARSIGPVGGTPAASQPGAAAR